LAATRRALLAGSLGVIIIATIGFLIREVDLLIGLKVHVSHLDSLLAKVGRQVLVLLLVNTAKGDGLGV
jgi:hypothetical protein